MKRTLMIVVLLVLAFGGTAVAAGKITGKHIKDESVTGIDFRDGSVSNQDVADGTLVAADFGPLPMGPTGLDGERGLRGPTGPQGPDGVPGIEYVIAERTLNGKGNQETLSVTCPPGKTALGGGVSTLDPTDVRVAQSAPLKDGAGWFGHLWRGVVGQTTAYVWAVCGSMR